MKSPLVAFPLHIGLLFDLFLVLFVVTAIWFDLTVSRIPNWLVLPCAALGLLANAFGGTQSLTDSFLGLACGIGLFIIPFAMGWMGAGDVKFFGAVGAILGVGWVPRVLFYTALSGLLMGLAVVVVKRVGAKTLRDGWSEFKMMMLTRGQLVPATITERVSRGAVALPYGVAIGIGTLIAYYCDPRGELAGF